MPLHGEAAVFGDEVLQIGADNPLKQLLKGGGPEIRQHQQHSFAGAQADIRLGHLPDAAGKQHPSVLHPDILCIHPAQLVTGQSLQPEQAGDGKFQI